MIDRFGQIEPKVLIAAAGYHYAGKALDLTAKLNEILQRLPTLAQLVVVPYARPEARAEDFATAARVSLWDDFYRPGGEPAFVPVPFEQPLYILYSSGTTGVPKCIVHGVGGTLLQHLKEHALHGDLKADDTLFYFTTCGWMMWNWLASGLALGATLVLYDGSPFHPGPERLMDLIDAEGISIFGTSAKYLAALQKPAHGRARAIGWSASRRCSPPARPWPTRASTTSTARSRPSCACRPSPAAPTSSPASPSATRCCRCGAASCNARAWAWTCRWDEHGQPVHGEKGELVCTRHFPSMPVGFWNDPDGEKFRAAYFETFPGVWAHGDYAEETAHGGLVIHGRSDAVLNPGGVRIGTAEIYRQVEKVEQVLESIAIGQDWQGDVRVVLFVRLREGVALDDACRRASAR